MKKFTDILSPASWVLALSAIYTALILLFHPTVWNVVLLFVVDNIVLASVTGLADRIFLKIHPAFAAFYPKWDSSAYGARDEAGRVKFLEDLIRFPAARAKYVALASMPKVIPAAIVVVFFWKRDISALEQAFKFMALEAIIFTWVYGIMYVELHDLVRRKLKELDGEFDLSVTFEKARLETSLLKAYDREDLALLAVPTWGAVLSAFLVLSGHESRSSAVVEEILGVVACVMMMSYWLYFQNKKAYRAALQEIFDTLTSPSFESGRVKLPCYSMPGLSHFSRMVGELSARLRLREREVSEFVNLETEKSRYRALGEIAGLVAHDLSSPLLVIGYCSDKVAEIIHDYKLDESLARRLQSNVNVAFELLNSLKSYIRNPNGRERRSGFFDAHRYVMQLLKMQFSKGRNCRIDVTVAMDPLMKDLYVPLARVDLVHVLHNIYKNMYEEFAAKSVTQPRIHIEAEAVGASLLKIMISDNGSGLSQEQYESMTGWDALRHTPNQFRQGLGLRLTRRMLEQQGLELAVAAVPRHGGTTFEIMIPLGPAKRVTHELPVSKEATLEV